MPEREHWVTTLTNSGTAKIIAFVLLGLLAIVVGVGLFTNKHVNILGIEFNGKDTVKTTTYRSPDTVFINQKENKSDAQSENVKIKTNKLPQVISTKKEKSVGDTLKSPSKFNVANANFNGPTQLGDNNVQNNNGILPRKMNKSEIMAIMNTYFPDRSIHIFFVNFGGADAEITSVKNQLIGIFHENGYTNIEKEFHTTIGIAPPDKIMFDSTRDQHALSIEIPYAK